MAVRGGGLLPNRVRRLCFHAVVLFSLVGAFLTTGAAQAASPQVPADLGQFKSNGTTAIPVGGTTTETTVIIKGTVSDPDGDQTELWVEVQPVGTAFAGNPAQIKNSGFVNSGDVAEVTVGGLSKGTSYHWRALAHAADGDSSWVNFGGNGENETDFEVSLPAAPTPKPTPKEEGSSATPTPPTGTPEATPPVPEADFTISCDPTSLAIRRGGSEQAVCTVTSIWGFDDPIYVAPDSSSVPCPDILIEPNPLPPPPANGTRETQVEIGVAKTAAVGACSGRFVARGGSIEHAFPMQVTILGGQEPFTLSCVPKAIEVARGQTATVRCKVDAPSEPLAAPIELDLLCPDRMAPDIEPNALPPRSRRSTVRISVPKSSEPGTHRCRIAASSGVLRQDVDVQLTVDSQLDRPLPFWPDGAVVGGFLVLGGGTFVHSRRFRRRTSR